MRLKRPGGSVAPSCTAAIGGTRVARNAGTIEAMRVTTTPMTSAEMIVRGRISIDAAGRPKPIASNRAWMPRAMPTPTASPMIDASRPMTSASPTTFRSTWPRVAPRVRTMPNSRTRWATVMEKVLKMMKAPTNSATPAKVSSAGVRKLEISPATSSLCSWAFSSAVSTFAVSGSAAATRSRSWVAETPSWADAKTIEVSPSRSNQRWASSKVVSTTVAPPIDSTSP